MYKLIQLAWRNLWRNKRRTLITSASVFFGVVLSSYMTSMQEGSYAQMIRTIVNSYSGYLQIHKKGYDDDKIIAGQGTATMEIAQELGTLDYLFVPIGGGGLISGNAIAAKHLFPGVKVIGVETEPANDCYQSFRKKEIVRINPPATIADGMRTQSVGKRNFEIILQYVDDVITVTDDQVIEMMRFFVDRMKVVVEPTGAVAPAAIYHNILGLSGKKVCAIISGGNVDPAFLKNIL